VRLSRMAKKPTNIATPPAGKQTVSDEAVKARTGKNWTQWFAILDKAGAKDMKHAEIAKYLREKQNVPSWWNQMITVCYERAQGVRAVHQSSAGHFNASCTRTIEASISDVYRAFADNKVRASWLAGDKLKISSTRENKTIRGAWGAKSRTAISLIAKGAGRTQISVEQTQLADAQDVARAKEFWSRRIDRLREKLTK
jgi:hypothetical protein